MLVKANSVDCRGRPRFHTFQLGLACTGTEGLVTNWGPLGGFQRQISSMSVLPASASSMVVWERSSPTQIAVQPALPVYDSVTHWARATPGSSAAQNKPPAAMATPGS